MQMWTIAIPSSSYLPWFSMVTHINPSSHCMMAMVHACRFVPSLSPTPVDEASVAQQQRSQRPIATTKQ